MEDRAVLGVGVSRAAKERNAVDWLADRPDPQGLRRPGRPVGATFALGPLARGGWSAGGENQDQAGDERRQGFALSHSSFPALSLRQNGGRRPAQRCEGSTGAEAGVLGFDR